MARVKIDYSTSRQLDEVAKDLLTYASASARREAMNAHCHEVYQKHFPKKIMLDRWDAVIKSVMTPLAADPPGPVPAEEKGQT